MWSLAKEGITKAYGFFFGNMMELMPLFLSYLIMQLVLSIGLFYLGSHVDMMALFREGMSLHLPVLSLHEWIEVLLMILSSLLMMSLSIILGRSIVLGESLTANLLDVVFSKRSLIVIGAALVSVLIVGLPFMILYFVKGISLEDWMFFLPVFLMTLWIAYKLIFMSSIAIVEGKIDPLGAFHLSSGYVMASLLVILVGSLLVVVLIPVIAFIMPADRMSLLNVSLSSLLEHVIDLFTLIPVIGIFFLYKHATNR